jgi:Ca2+-transporting ATPase
VIGKKVQVDKRAENNTVEIARGVDELERKAFPRVSNIATILGLPLPLAAVQILYVNLATDGLPALALAVDPPEGDVMKHRPRDPKSSIFTTRLLCMMGLSGAWSTVVNLSIFAWALRNDMSIDEATSICFVTLVLLQFWNAYMFRSDTRSGLRRPFGNWWLNLAVLWEAVLLFIIVEVPFFQKLMGTYPLPPRDWVIVILASATIIPVMELFKIFWKQKETT